MSDQIIVLSDRTKELSRSTGTTPFILDGAARGFSAFGDFYASGDAIYYAATDGTDYEVGSGQYHSDPYTNSVTRFPFRSTNSNSLVSFNDGIKEVQCGAVKSSGERCKNRTENKNGKCYAHQ